MTPRSVDADKRKMAGRAQPEHTTRLCLSCPRPWHPARTTWLITSLIGLACVLAPALVGCNLNRFRPEPNEQHELVAQLQRELDQAQTTVDRIRKLQDQQIQKNAKLERTYPELASRMQKLQDQLQGLQRPVPAKPGEFEPSRGQQDAATP